MSAMHRFFFSVFCRLIRLLLCIRYKIEVSGLEEVSYLKGSKPGILFLPNHPAEIDPIILMAILGPKFFPRGVVVEHFYYLKGFKKILDFGRVVPVPSMEEKANKWKKKELEKTLSYIQKEMDGGENFIIYPAGKLKRSGFERIGGASFVHALLSQRDAMPAVLIRTTGLWGSSFSVGKTGKTPPFGKTLAFAFKVILKNLLFFVPKRKLLIEFNVCPPLPRKEGRLEFNRALELWYNNYPEPGEELLKSVPYSIWGKEEEQILKVHSSSDEKLVVSVSPKIEEEVLTYLSTLSKTPKEKIHQDTHLSFDLGLDSLDIAEIHGFLDKKYDAAAIPLGDLKKVKDVLRAIAEKDLFVNLEKKEDAPAFPEWFKEKKRKPVLFAEGKTIPEVFLNNAKRMGSVIACADARAGVLSYRKFKTAVFLLAEEFRSLQGDKVGLLLPSSVGAYLTILALLFAGKVPVMLNWTSGKNALNHALKVSGLKVVLTSKKFLDKIHLEDLGEVEDVFVFLEEIKESISLKKKIKAFWLSFGSIKKLMKVFPVEMDPSKTAVLLFTSGSESMPKAVPLSHNHLLSNQRSALPFAGLTSKDSLYGVLPPFHSFGFSLTGLLPLLSGLKVFYAPDPTDSYLMASDIKRMQLSAVCLAPSFMRSLFTAASPGQLDSVTLVIVGAEKYAPDLPLFVKKQLPASEWLEGYGITECSPVVSLHIRGQKNNGVGRPLPGIEIAFFDPLTLEPVAPGQDGEICIRGPSVFDGYLGVDSPDCFIHREGEKWYRSGDLGHLDEEGNLCLTDRLKRTIKIGGEMVSLSAVEQSILHETKERKWCALDKEGPLLAVVALKSDKPELVLFATFEINIEEVNRALRESGWGRIVKISRVVPINQIPLTGTGKMHYRMLEDQLKVLHV